MTDKAVEEIAGYNLTALWSPSFGEPGPLVTQPTRSVLLDGTEDTLYDGPTGRVYHAAAQPYTFVALVKITDDTPPAFATIAYNGDGASGTAGYGMGVLSGTLDFGGVNENVAFLNSGADLTLNAWHLCMMGRDSGTIYWWLDGERTPSTSASVPQTPTDGFSIGSHRKSGSWQRLWPGYVSEVAFFKRILTDDDAEALQLARDPADWEFGGAVGAAPVVRWSGEHAGRAATWARIVSPTHVADAVDADAVARLGPRQRVTTVPDADSDAKAADYADAALAASVDSPASRGPGSVLVSPWHPGVELGDCVRVDVSGDGVDAALFLVDGVRLDYERGGAYAATLTLAQP
ncbi:MAG: LamG-like jellyroll fold domain-containing protein [Dehalococcoidia bacterium]